MKMLSIPDLPAPLTASLDVVMAVADACLLAAFIRCVIIIPKTTRLMRHPFLRSQSGLVVFSERVLREATSKNVESSRLSATFPLNAGSTPFWLISPDTWFQRFTS